LAGMLLGGVASRVGLQFIATNPYLDILAQLGMLLLLFEVGVDLSVRDLFAVGPSSVTVALIGTVSSLVVGAAAAAWVMPDSRAPPTSSWAPRSRRRASASRPAS